MTISSFTIPKLSLECGKKLSRIEIAYETFGQLNQDKSNAVLVCHTLTGSSSIGGEAGWWQKAIGPGKLLDTDRFFFLCSNVLGGCHGSTGPGSLCPEKHHPYGLDFPEVSISDMVHCQKKLLEHLSIPQWHSAIGGCFGGFQVLKWLELYPQYLQSAVVIAATDSCAAHNIAIFEVMRRAVFANADLDRAMALPTMISAIFSMPPHLLSERFSRKRKKNKAEDFFSPHYEVESYLQHIGEKSCQYFHPLSLLYLTRAMSHFEVSLEQINFSGPLLFVSYKNDWRYPSEAMESMKRQLSQKNPLALHRTFEHPYGHHAFINAPDQLKETVDDFIGNRRR
ncbi:MAG: homoserine O-acetyltransferase [Simkaniaceae bacterium]